MIVAWLARFYGEPVQASISYDALSLIILVILTLTVLYVALTVFMIAALVRNKRGNRH